MCRTCQPACVAAPTGAYAPPILCFGLAGAALARATATLPTLTRTAPMIQPFRTLLHAEVVALGLWLQQFDRLPT